MTQNFILKTSGLTKEFKGFVAVNDVNLGIQRGHIHALIGPNGAGKTTCFNLLTKFLSPSRGSIYFNGVEITREEPAQIARRGVIRSFQISAVFPHLTVMENVRIALQRKLGVSYHFWRSPEILNSLNDRAMELLGYVGLAGFADVITAEMSYGRKRALEIATTLALDPELMLLDEPTQGMGHEDVDRVMQLIKKVAANRTILMVEHNMKVVSGIRAVGFTGSRAGGLALSRRAAAREVPIPVYAEMSSVNPVVLLPQALAARAESIGQAFVDSLTLGVGQFCTNPGIVIAIDGPELDQFVDVTAQSLRNKAAGTMLTPGIAAAYAAGVKLLAEHECVETIASGQATSGGCDGRAHFFATDAASFLAHPELKDEIFGPSSILVRCRDTDEIGVLLECLEGQLTATLQMDSGDVPLARRLLPLLEDKVGRILVNGFPTGVEVSHAMVHGGPFPATTDSRTTSVGSAAIDRFLRPVCYQNFPADLLPAALSDVNVQAIPRMVNGNVVLPN